MGNKISAYKAQKIFELHQEGNNQAAIAKKLHIDPSTVSKHLSKLEIIKEQKGLKSALQEFEVIDQTEENQKVLEEFYKSGLPIGDVATGIYVNKLFQECGVKSEEYKVLIQTCLKIKNTGYLEAAMKLNKLENQTHMDYQQLIDKGEKTYQQLGINLQELEKTKAALNEAKTELNGINKQKEQATQDLKVHMTKIGMDEQRIQQVEILSLALKKAKVTDQQLTDYIKRQELLNKANVEIDTFVAILNECKVSTADDGHQLLVMLSKYHNLAGAITQQEAKLQALTKEVSVLGEKAKIKNQLIETINKLQADRNKLEADITDLQRQKEQVTKEILRHELELKMFALDFKTIQSNNQALTDMNLKLGTEIENKQVFIKSLDNKTKEKEQKVADLQEQENKRDALVKEITELEEKFNQQGIKWKVFEGFLGMVQSESFESLKKNALGLLTYITNLKPGKYTVDFLMNYIIENIAGPQLQILGCPSCGVKFVVNKPPLITGYSCPYCGSSQNIKVDKDAKTLLKSALSESQAKPAKIIKMSKLKKLKDEPGDNSPI